jgi:hypothetical protein
MFDGGFWNILIWGGLLAAIFLLTSGATIA